ncbi:hypothetical protein, partial [Streptomyces sp. NPDC049590]|uniref:hypothetical protein n=1 Tax=Streptomyces sp. NPDC049590 TaxID=3154834 RepID=UPI00341D5773
TSAGQGVRITTESGRVTAYHLAETGEELKRFTDRRPTYVSCRARTPARHVALPTGEFPEAGRRAPFRLPALPARGLSRPPLAPRVVRVR